MGHLDAGPHGPKPKRFLRINPKFSVETYGRSVSHKNQAKLDRYVEALRQAGLK